MDREEILKLAEETGFLINQNKPVEGYEYKRSFYPEKIEAFANAIAALEREVSAIICDERGCDCGEVIRSRGTKGQ